jgi:hypothetical protein
LIVQSVSIEQALFNAHLLHEPPQSTSVSSLSLAPLEQLVAAQLFEVHCKLKQSEFAVQDLPSLQTEQVEPPQSTSVSSWFLMPSLQVGATHTPFEQDKDEQSDPVEHCLPIAHLEEPRQLAPPQSTSVSPKFLIPSAHAVTQTLFTQVFSRQSNDVVQLLPFAHLSQTFPPQSTSVSPIETVWEPSEQR